MLKVKLTNSKKENKIIDVDCNNLLELENHIIRKYGYNFIIARDYDKGLLVCTNGIYIEDIKQKEHFDYFKKFI